MEACGCCNGAADSDLFSGNAHTMVVHGDFAPAAFSSVAVIGSEGCRNVAELRW
ncbi:hypothetical protein DEO72_LG3g819 [Vigna unguiculata]|uniref:Uncharacterized protein n=1 Tax=Vigna unguiculata TaxID=3917 RepID=A0A4D6LCR0_VIGUN|nr:hypothetical protein DEO72_LG3g819 [Vigna unguiculata]